MGETLLSVLHRRFTVPIDPDSNPGKILDTLTPLPPFGDASFDGQASVSNLAFMPTSSGLSVRAAQPNDMLVWQIPDQTAGFTIKPAQGVDPLRVEVVLLPLTLPLPGLRPAQLGPDGIPQEAGNDPVKLVLPSLVLRVTENSAQLAAAQVGGGGLQVTMQPPLALIGQGTVLGFGFDQAILKLDGPEEPQVQAPSVQLFISPPAIQALQMHGNADNLLIGLGADSGISGDFTLAQDQGAVTPAKPAFLDHLVARLRLDRSSVTRLEMSGQVNFRSAVEQHVLGLDGVEGPDSIDFTLGLVLNVGWQVGLQLRAAQGQGFLWRTHGTNASLPRDTLGAYAAFAPLLNSALSGESSGGEIVDLALTTGMAGGMAAAGVIQAVSVTLYGAELIAHQAPGGGTDLLLFFEVETEVNVKSVVIETTQPIKIRQKGIGLRLDFGGATPLRPVFDTARGYDLDLSDPGLFKVKPDILADILQPERTRMSRGSPLNLEIDLAPRLDLGVVRVEKTSVRIPIDLASPPSLTGLGVSLEVPGLLTGGGYLQITDKGFVGNLDASLAPPLGLRVGAGLALSKIPPDAVGFLATLEVDFPLPLPLGATGLGLIGFLGLFGMHYRRNMGPDDSVLSWYKRAHGDLTQVKPELWEPQLKHWAFGVGAVLGTLEGGFLLNLKGALVIEAPGPQILIFMNASLLWPPPGLSGTDDMGGLLAVIEISPGRFSIGLAINYNIEPLLEISLPVQASFAGLEEWSIDVGTIKDPATVKFLFTLRVAGYLMIHGKGIQDSPLLPNGAYAVAAGIRAAFTWGPEDIGLYLKVAAQADVGISFKPFMIAGRLSISGALHLFIIGIEVSADADVLLTASSFFICAEVCGSVDFFFFEVEGCVTLKLGSQPPLPPAEPLVRGVSLHSRTPARVVGNAPDRPVDGSLGEALEVGQLGDLPVVPVDAIPAIQFEMRPAVDPGCEPLGQPLVSKLSDQDWVRRGGRFYRYTLTSIDLSAADGQGNPLNPPLGDGEAKVVWWDRNPQPGGQDNDVQLALLNWIPDPTPVAAERTPELKKRLHERWGVLCTPVADSANALWTFQHTPFGPSRRGWTLQGTLSPDAPGARRSSDPPRRMRITEPWRSGISLADAVVQVEPARVIGGMNWRDSFDPADHHRPLQLPGRALLAPFSDQSKPDLNGDHLPIRIVGDPAFDALFRLARSQPLRSLIDSLRVEIGPSVFLRMALFMRPHLRDSGALGLQTLDAQGQPNGPLIRLDPGNMRLPGGPGDFPGEWTDPNGPWAADTDLFTGPLDLSPWVRGLFESDLPFGTAALEIGLVQPADLTSPAWGLLGAEALSQAEIARAEFDQTTRSSELKTIQGALGTDASEQALLLPGATYTLTVNYKVATAEPDEHGNPPKVDADTPQDAVSQRFSFRTDNQPPSRLDPWVLATDPGPDQAFTFWGDPLQIVFSTNATRKLFKAYGKDLFAVVKAASGHHPSGSQDFDRSMVNLAATLRPAKELALQIATPWEDQMREIVSELPCQVEVHQVDRSERIPLTLDLDPLTHYILDITTDPEGGEQTSPLFRRSFTTSRYRDLTALADSVKNTSLQHRFLTDIAPLAKLSSDHPGGGAALQVRDLELEIALRQVGWGDLAAVTQPQVTVIWQSAGGAFQPAAVLISTPEPLWRWRQTPAEVLDGDNVHRYRMQPVPLLEVVETPAGGPLVSRLVFSSGGGRTLAFLQPGGRGRQLRLGLNRRHHPLFEDNSDVETAALVEANLAAAPWEEQA
jgi:hypothetical protein